MGNAFLSGIGKITNGEGGAVYINIVELPVSDTSVVSTRFLFLSKQEVNTVSDLIAVLNFYKEYGQPVILVGGDYVIRSNSVNYRYAVVDLFVGTNNYVHVTYRKSAGAVDDTVKLFQIGGELPSNWKFSNIKL